jgi:hypothetical protein
MYIAYVFFGGEVKPAGVRILTLTPIGCRGKEYAAILHQTHTL